MPSKAPSQPARAPVWLTCPTYAVLRFRAEQSSAASEDHVVNAVGNRHAQGGRSPWLPSGEPTRSIECATPWRADSYRGHSELEIAKERRFAEGDHLNHEAAESLPRS